jgi:hypothetical protein
MPARARLTRGSFPRVYYSVVSSPPTNNNRKGRTLTFDDIQHYRKIIAALSETDRLMGEIDGV